MCIKCRDILRKYINTNINQTFQTARGISFTIERQYDDMIVINTEDGKPRPFHLTHLANCYHWMSIQKRSIHGVGSSLDSIRGLIGATGQLSKCELCERSPAYIWGILQSMNNVKIGPNNTLSI